MWIIAISDDCFELYVLFYRHFYIIDTRTLFFLILSENLPINVYISTTNISYKMQFTYVVNFFESIKMGIHSSENLRLTYDFKLKGMVDETMFILSNTCVFCRILFGQPFHN